MRKCYPSLHRPTTTYIVDDLMIRPNVIWEARFEKNIFVTVCAIDYDIGELIVEDLYNYKILHKQIIRFELTRSGKITQRNISEWKRLIKNLYWQENVSHEEPLNEVG